MDIKRLKTCINRRATELALDLRESPYNGGVCQLGFPTLEHRRDRYDKSIRLYGVLMTLSIPVINFVFEQQRG